MGKQTKRLYTKDRKAQLLNIATAVFSLEGYKKASLGKIAEKANITKAAIYYHFKNKEEILFNLVNSISDRLISDLKEINERKDDPVNQLKEMITVQLSYMKQDKASIKILLEDRHFLEKKKYSDTIKSRMDEIVEIYRNKLIEIRDIGMLRDINLITATFTLFAVINWLYHWYNPSGPMSIEEIADHITDIIYYGIIQDDKKKRS